MRQAVRRGVAPLNTNPKWPEGFVAALREAGAQEKMIPFLMTWVRRFFAQFPGRNRRDLGRVEIEAFLGEMARRRDISNWQIAQARDALELYYEQFRGIALEPRPDDVLQITPSPTSTVPSREQGRLPAADGQIVHEPSTKAIARYQGPRVAVNVVSRQVQPSVPIATGWEPRTLAPNRPLLPRKVAGDVDRSAPGSVDGKTNWGLLEAKVREYLRVGHYSYRTEQTYLGWIRQFVAFHQGRKPSTMDAGHVRDFLRHLAIDRQVASSTQNQALNAVVFLFKAVIKKEIGDFSDFQRARQGLRLPVVASREEIKAVIDRLSGRERFMGVLLYGTGMRINELLRLRVQDVQFDQSRIMVRAGKGDTGTGCVAGGDGCDASVG